MHILITAGNSSKAQKLKNQVNTADIILGDYMELPAFMLMSGQMLKLPDPSSITYTHEMLSLCLDKQIGIIYALRDEELLLLREAEQLFAEYEVIIVHGF